eukprot:11210933-Lingulodinium_polyedra.AAC.1
MASRMNGCLARAASAGASCTMARSASPGSEALTRAPSTENLESSPAPACELLFTAGPASVAPPQR